MSNFSLFCLFSHHRVLSFISYHLVIVLHLESFESNLFELDIYRSVLLRFQEDELFCTVITFFSRFLLLSMYQNTFESIRPCFEKTIRHESTTLNRMKFYDHANVIFHIKL